MEGTTIIENTGAPSTEVDETYAEGKAVAAHLKDQEPDFKLIDSLHPTATQGEVNKELEDHGKHLDQILTPSGNTILHIYIISRPRPPKTDEFTSRVLGMCPNLLLKANEKGETPLHFAAKYGHGDIVEELMQECKQPYYKDQENGVETKRLMLEKTNEAKDTALHEAVRYERTDVVNKLIEADTGVPYDANGSGETPLYLAAERGYKKIVEKILDKCKSPADYGPMGRTALHAAVIRRDKDMADLLLKEKEYSSRKKDELGRFALHYAALLGYDEIVDKLLHEYPSAAYKADYDGNTALHLAAGNGKAKAVNKLIEMCPNCCELVDNRGRNALHLALTSADGSTVEIFLRKPALANLINQKDKDGDTPLLQLANSGSYRRTFMSHDKVDKLVFNKDNKNAADIFLDNDLLMANWGKFLWKLKMIKDKRYRRIIVSKQEVREGKVNRPSIIGIRNEDIKKPKEERSEEIMKEKGDRSEDTEKKNDDGSEKITKMIKGAEQTYLVVATLIATVTFAAALALPGGYIGGDKPNEGTAFLARSVAFQAFVIFDTIAFVVSCLSMICHLRPMGLQTDKTQLFILFQLELGLIYCAMVAMVFAFVTGLYAVLYPNKSLAITVCVIGCTVGAAFSLRVLIETGIYEILSGTILIEIINMENKDDLKSTILYILEGFLDPFRKKMTPTRVDFYRD